jgi:hypothetical protein
MRQSPVQIELFADRSAQRQSEGKSVEDRVSHKKLHVNKSTFKGGLDAQVHRWFRLTPSFGPDLVRHVLEEYGADDAAIVLDPFCGAGTTPIECRRLGLRSFGFEINPFLHFVGSTCLQWNLDAAEGRKILSRILADGENDKVRLADVHIEQCGLLVPTIHDVYRWWRADVLKDMLIIKAMIDKHAPSASWRNFFRLALAAVLVPDLTNVTLGRLQLHFIDRSTHEIFAFPTYERHTLAMLSDLDALAAKEHPAASIAHTDSTTPNVPPGPPANLVITSPPYPNRYSYVWNTRPHLYMLDFFHGKKEAADLDKRTIGGTWGTATSVLAKGVIEPEHSAVRDAAGDVVAQIRKADTLMANYVMKYFNLLARQIVAMDAAVARRVQVAYVVGNSCVKDVYVETDVILGKIFEGLGLGYRTKNVERFRKRHSGVDLYETTVYAERV